MLFRCLFLALFFIASTAQAGPIYVYKEADGAVRFTTKRPPKEYNAKVYKSQKGSYSKYKVTSARYSLSPYHYKSSKLFTKKYSSIITEASIRHGIAESLIKAVIHAESAFNPKAVSHKGAKGLMQLMPSNIKKYGVKNPYSPQENIYAGTKLLSKLLKKYNGNLSLALAAYNAGEGAVKKYKGIPPYKETKHYVKKVIKLKSLYG